MADKTILTQKLIDLEGLSVFWGKTKDYIDGKITTVNNVIEENERVTNEALNDLNTRTSNNADAISSIQQELESLSGGAGSIATQINTALEPYKVKDVDTTATNGVNLSLDATTAKVKVNVTPGSVVENNESVVTGGAVYAAVNTAKSDSKVTIEATGDNTSDIKKYTFKQGDVEVGTINIPKDLVVVSGEVVICAKEGENFGKKCIELTFTSGDPVHIPVDELVDVYTAGDSYITISDDNKISVNKDQIISGLAVANDVYSKTDANNTFVAKEGYVAYSDDEKNKLAGIAAGAQVNVIETVKVNDVALTVNDDKSVNIDLSSYLKSTDEKVKTVDTTATNGINLSLDTNGKLDVTVNPGSVAENNDSVVTGGAVWTAITDASTAAKNYTDELGKIVKGVYDAGQLVTNGHAQRIEALEKVVIASDEDIIDIFA